MVDCDFEDFQDRYAPFRPSPRQILASIDLFKSLGLLEQSPTSRRRPLRWSAALKPLDNLGFFSIVYDHLLNNLDASEFSFNNDVNTTPQLGHSLYVYCMKPRNKLDELNHGFDTESYLDIPPLFPSWLRPGTTKTSMFTPGVMICTNRLTVGYFSPTHCAKSAEFDIKKYCYSVLSVCLSLLLASPSAMGFNPTIHRFEDSGSPFFVYEMPVQLSNNETDESRTRFFRTIGYIYQHQSRRAHPCITRRITKVRAVVEQISIRGADIPSDDQPKPTMALKNTWLPVGIMPEKEVLDQIFADIEVFGERLEVEGEPGYFRELDDETKEMARKCLKDGSYKDYFVTIACQHVGKTSRPVSNKSNHNGRPENVGWWTYWYYEYLGGEEAFGEPRQQHRVVYGDLGWSFHLVPDLVTAFRVLRDVRMALVFLFLAGWVHGDINPNNILFQEGPGRKGKRISSDHRMTDNACTPGFLLYDMRKWVFKQQDYNP
ncbi:hypothetical protein P691DRAFT_761949 [Macrolepiota fuliginosa MF-IS2]|uniref:Fungal-type protein kinase domain-containing protein n=1 Tax=Macrolepiota fuliginosa MF-IS2 TaxID=1400762 RepID=A0A9P5X9Z8_9AGAR|nr:hypothetical protein P691DRAFT_761949 [Macrolepiota fuliginosa MF-IS2]